MEMGSKTLKFGPTTGVKKYFLSYIFQESFQSGYGKAYNVTSLREHKIYVNEQYTPNLTKINVENNNAIPLRW